MVRELFSKPVMHGRREMTHPTPNQGLCKAEPIHDHAVCILWVYPSGVSTLLFLSHPFCSCRSRDITRSDVTSSKSHDGFPVISS